MPIKPDLEKIDTETVIDRLWNRLLQLEKEVELLKKKVEECK